MYISNLIFALVFYSVAVDGKAINTEYEHYPQAHGWLKLHTKRETWRNARLTCYNEGAVLASPQDDAMWVAMDDIISSHSRLSHVFTGISDTLSTGIFQSLEGTPLSQMSVPQAHGAPDNQTESCLSLVRDGMLRVSQCSHKHHFICYKKDPTPTLSCGSEGYSADITTGSCYKFHKEGKYWKDAFATCADEGGYLTIINSDQEAEVLKGLFRNNFEGRKKNDVMDVVHIGFVDWGKKGGQWMTIQGETLEEAGYAKWHNGEPNNKTNQFCGGMNIDGGLDDVNCYNGDPQENTRSFICEQEPQSVGGSSNNDPQQRNFKTDDLISESTTPKKPYKILDVLSFEESTSYHAVLYDTNDVYDI